MNCPFIFPTDPRHANYSGCFLMSQNTPLLTPVDDVSSCHLYSPVVGWHSNLLNAHNSTPVSPVLTRFIIHQNRQQQKTSSESLISSASKKTPSALEDLKTLELGNFSRSPRGSPNIFENSIPDTKGSPRFGAFYNSENLLLGNSFRTLTKSVSYQDLSSEVSTCRSMKLSDQHAKSDQNLGPFKSSLNIVLKKSSSEQTPKIPKLPKTELISRHIPEVENCSTCDKRSKLKQLCSLMNPKDAQDIQITSFEGPNPCTMTISSLCNLSPNSSGSSIPINQRLYQNIPFCPPQKTTAQTQTSQEEIPRDSPSRQFGTNPDIINQIAESQQQQQQQSELLVTKKRLGSRKEKSSSVKSKKGGSLRRKKKLDKQPSVLSDTTVDKSNLPSPRILRDLQYEDNRGSSSSRQGSPRKDSSNVNNKKVSYFGGKKKTPPSSGRSSRSKSLENSREEKRIMRSVSNVANSERENSISSREVAVKERPRKNSTGSGSVPWCACWGNGCV